MRKPRLNSSDDERRWCAERQVDWSILKEVLILMEEI